MYKYLCLVIVLSFTGCNLPTEEVVEITHTIQVSDENKIPALEMVLSSVSREDTLNIYKYCMGMSLWCQNVPGDTYLLDVFQALANTQEKYGWQKNKYPNWNDSVELYLRDEGFGAEGMPTQIISENNNRDKLVNVFNTLAKSAKQSYLNRSVAQ